MSDQPVDPFAVVETTEDVLGDFGFRITWKVQPHWADLAVQVFTGRGVDPEHDTLQPYLTGFIKWDGCMEFDCEGVHWCDPGGIVRHAQLLAHCWFRAFELMHRDPPDEWPADDRLRPADLTRPAPSPA